MVGRCRNPNDRWYGARGIAVCERWLNPENFLADMGERPSLQHTIDRIDNTRGYEPGNCRWATKKEQSRNRASNHFLTIDGETLTVAEWAERYGLKYGTVQDRLRRGWPPDRAVKTTKLLVNQHG